MKIFEIGVMKTGTTSLGKAYEILGYKQMGWNAELFDQWQLFKNYEDLFQVIDQYDAFHDGPWHNVDYKILDAKYPNSKFILLERDEESWIKSVEYHTSPQYNVNKVEDRYLDYLWLTDRDQVIKQRIYWKKKKYQKIQEYFINRPKDLLVMKVTEGWDPLCCFLDQPIPSVPFPHENKSILR
jgi:hypothetical protein